MKKSNCLNIRFFIVVFLSLVTFVSSYAQSNKQVPVDVEGDVIEYSETTKQITVTGHVDIEYEDVTITADKAIAYPESKDIYAKGNVTLKKGEDVLKADRIYYNFQSQKGTLVEGDFKSGKVYGTGEKLEKVSEDKLIALKGRFTTCEFDIPHYTIRANKINIYLGEKVVAKNIFFYVRGLPIMYCPYYSHSLKDKETGIRITPGHDSDWGNFVLTSLRYYFSHESNGWLHFDWRENLGFGYGLDYKYITDDYGEGLLQTYYTPERDTSDVTQEGDIPVKSDKYRVKLEHNWNIDSATKAYLDINKYEDEDFIKDYFYEEYIGDPQPRSRLSITTKRRYYAVSFLLRKQLNDFLGVTETLPEVELDINNYQLGDTRLFYSSTYMFDYFNDEQANTGIDNHVSRFHTDNKLSYPTSLIGPLDWIDFTPYAGGVETFYSRDEDGQKRDFFRGQWYAGYDLTTKIFRIFDVEGRYFGAEVNRLRHLVIPRVQFAYRNDPTVDASKLFEYDSIDTLDDKNVYTFSLENKLQTKYSAGENVFKEVNLIENRTSVDFYAKPDDNPFSNITNELTIRPNDWVKLGLDVSYNSYSEDFEIVNARTELKQERWTLELSSRYTKDTDDLDAYHQGIMDASYKISPKWKLGIFERYDFDEGELAEYQYSLTRDLHCWTAELNYHSDDEGHSIWIVFKTKAFPKFPFSFGT